MLAVADARYPICYVSISVFRGVYYSMSPSLPSCRLCLPVSRSSPSFLTCAASSPLSLLPVVFLFITITNISHLSPPHLPLSLASLPASPVPILFHLHVPLVPSLTLSPDGCRGEALLILDIILTPITLCRKPLTSQWGWGWQLKWPLCSHWATRHLLPLSSPPCSRSQ